MCRVAAIRPDIWTRMAVCDRPQLRLLHNALVGFLHSFLHRQTSCHALQSGYIVEDAHALHNRDIFNLHILVRDICLTLPFY
jgi:hypothetical protein